MFSSKREINTFKQNYDFETRSLEANRIREKYPDQFPVIVLRSRRSKLPPLDKHKFLLSGDMTLAQFQAVIRRRSKLDSTQTIYVYVVDDNGKYTMPQTSQTIRAIHQQYGDKDGFLYVTYFQDDAFGKRNNHFFDLASEFPPTSSSSSAQSSSASC